MIKIGVVGSDYSHALAFSRLPDEDWVLGNRYRVVGLWGEEPERTAKVARGGEIPVVVARPEDLID